MCRGAWYNVSDCMGWGKKPTNIGVQNRVQSMRLLNFIFLVKTRRVHQKGTMAMGYVEEL